MLKFILIITVSARIWSCWSLWRLAYHGDLGSLYCVSCFSLHFSRALAASCVLYNRTEHSQGFSICLILICIYWPFFGLVSFCSLRSFRFARFACFVSVVSFCCFGLSTFRVINGFWETNYAKLAIVNIK